MNIGEEYRALFDSHVSNKAKLVIIKYNSVKKKYDYRPYSHIANKDAINKLSELIIDNMIFYAFSEEEIVEMNDRNGILDDLRIAAKYALNNRLPKRNNPTTDGTPGELLLDILIQVYEPLSHKLIARAKFRQMGDNFEIKGYDALYFTQVGKEISLWLGQVKSGSCDYCKSGIKSDLNQKYLSEYFSNAMYYIADKVEKSSPLIDILNKINGICYESIKYNWSSEYKKEILFKFLKSSNITIKIPCVLAYTAEIYDDSSKLSNEITSETNGMIDYFDQAVFNISVPLNVELIYYIFPIENVQSLREAISLFKRGE
jgi:hypothetical protein